MYAVFWNPRLQFSNAWNFLDGAVSLVDTGGWELAHADLYHANDTARSAGRVVPGLPPGTAILVAPLYLAWRAVFGSVATAEAFQAFNGFAALILGGMASALAAVEVGRLAGWLGAARRGQILAALLFAFGTQSFQLGTMLSKESLTGLAVVAATRLAVVPGGAGRRAWAGAVAGGAATLTQSAALLGPLLAGVVLRREGRGRALALVAGCLPPFLALAAYNTALFGRPWSSAYFFLGGVSGLAFVSPKPAIVLDLLVGTRGGLVLYSPFLLLGLAALVGASVRARRGEALTAGILLAGLWLASASWQSQFVDRADFAHGLGPRHLFPVVPLLAAFGAPALERLGCRGRVLLGLPSVLFGYLGAQAGIIPHGEDPLPYAVKTWLSGTGMTVLFKEALPGWLGLETLHARVSRPDVSALDLLHLLPTGEGLVLAGNQVLFVLMNLLAVGGVAWLVRWLWRGREAGS
ncbi:MAG: hypothetical protein HY727_06720 [Candidatus Rokubacteria bacterium]|nr:hypothetical protein [Candidatus Rokubacteria bacterium]